jgi:hypothetical protein
MGIAALTLAWWHAGLTHRPHRDRTGVKDRWLQPKPKAFARAHQPRQPAANDCNGRLLWQGLLQAHLLGRRLIWPTPPSALLPTIALAT